MKGVDNYLKATNTVSNCHIIILVKMLQLLFTVLAAKKLMLKTAKSNFLIKKFCAQVLNVIVPSSNFTPLFISSRTGLRTKQDP